MSWRSVLAMLIGVCEDHGRQVRFSTASGNAWHIDDNSECEGIIVT